MDIEKSRSDRENAAERARRRELELIQPLMNSSDTDGVFGKQSGNSLKRLPSMAYWAGLGRLKFRLFPGVQDQYHRALRNNRVELRRDDSGDIELGVGLTGNWNPHIPTKPEGFPQGITLTPTKKEADFFREQLRMNARDSLFYQLVELNEDVPAINYPWEHPRIAEFPDSLRYWLTQAQCYAELMHGAQLLYNLMLAEAWPKPTLIDEYQTFINEWREYVHNQLQRFESWDRTLFWRDIKRVNPRIPPAAERFSETWIKLSLSDAGRDILKWPECRSLIEDRELRLKGARARLRSRAHLEAWGGSSGAAKLSYRWGITRTLAQDIVNGLKTDAQAA